MAEIQVSKKQFEGAQVATVIVDRAAKLNALNSDLIATLRTTFETLATQDDLHAVVLEGAGSKAWVGGADIVEMAVLTPKTAREFISNLHGAMRAVRDLPAPVIAKLDGFALGGGMELAAACDLRVASTNARFGMPEVQVGLPSVIEASLLPRLMGSGRAGRLMLTGEVIDAERAFAWGFVEEVVTPENLDAAVDAVLGHLCRSGIYALRSQKKLLRQWEAVSPDQAAEASVAVFGDAFETDEPGSRLARFVKRPRP